MTRASPRLSPFRALAVALALAALVASGETVAATFGLPLPRETVAALRQAGVPPSALGVYVHEVGHPLPVLAHNAEAPMNPASTMKLATTWAALELLGPAYAWRTDARVEGTLADGVLEGNLVLEGHGDPAMTLEAFWLFLRDLRARGLKDIRGDLVLDRSWFAPMAHDPARFDNEPLRPYNVGPDALLVNFKAVRFTFVPDPAAAAVSVRAEPHPPGLALAAGLKLVDGPCGDWRAGTRAAFVSQDAEARAAFTGTYPLACGEKTWHVSLFSHTGYVGGLFRQIWTELGGTLSGGVREGRATDAARPLARAESRALSELVRDMNKLSNNVMARQILLTLDAERNGPPARVERAATLVRDWLAGKGIPVDGLVIENGSGLSRAERISPRALGRLLVAAWGSPVMPELAASLPLTAVDGTMKKRTLGTGAAGQAHVKTGTLEGVRAVAGYVLDTTGRRWAVAGIVNHANAAQAQPALDALLAWVARGPRGTAAGAQE